MTEEEAQKQKEYNAKYFKEHRAEILEKMNCPVVCPHCAKIVRKHQLVKHQRTNYYMKKQAPIQNPANNYNLMSQLDPTKTYVLEVLANGIINITPKLD